MDAMQDRTAHETISTRQRVLVADDDPEMRALIAYFLKRAGYWVVEASDGVEVVDRMAPPGQVASGITAIVSDVKMPGLGGLDLLTALRCASVEIPVILMTAFPDDAMRAEARLLGAAALFEKPLDVAALTTTLRAAMDRRRGQRAG
jgi:DNA-binding response OmpR family regulator